MSRTVLEDRHLPRFESLTQEGAQLVLARLRERGALPLSRHGVPIVDGPTDGCSLFAVCRDAGLDHAGVVLSLAAETTPAGIAAIEALVGRPIQHWSRSATASAAAAPRPQPRGVAVQRPKSYDHLRIVSVVPNPKKPGSATYLRFANWAVGRTVAECMSAGLTRADADWDISRGFVVLEEAAS